MPGEVSVTFMVAPSELAASSNSLLGTNKHGIMSNVKFDGFRLSAPLVASYYCTKYVFSNLLFYGLLSMTPREFTACIVPPEL